MDELLAGAERVEARDRTAQRVVGLGAALLACGATVAVIVAGTAYGLWTGLWVFLLSGWQH
jgi:hypothetical protein